MKFKVSAQKVSYLAPPKLKFVTWLQLWSAAVPQGLYAYVTVYIESCVDFRNNPNIARKALQN